MKKFRFIFAGTITTITTMAIMAVTALLVATTVMAAPELYRWVDKDGKVTYSDTPPPKDAVSAQKKKLGDNSAGSGNGGEDAIPFALKSAMQRNPVVLYTNDCGELCDQARTMLAKRGIPFVSRNPETDPGASEALKELTGALSVPTLAVGTGNQIGFNESGWNAALDGAGYPKFNALSPNLKTPPKPIVESLRVPAPAGTSSQPPPQSSP